MAPKYKEISDLIVRDIKEGKYNENNKLPREDDLIEIHQVSRNTIRKAIDLLVKRGIVMPIQGSGMFLRKTPAEGCINLEEFFGLSASYKNIETRVIEFELIKADEQVAVNLQCNEETPVYFVKRLRIMDGKKFVIEYSYYNKDVIPYLNQEIINSSIYRYITEDLKFQIGYVDRVIEAGKLNADDAKHLGLQAGDPALISVNRAMLKSGVIFDYSIDIHNYKHTKFLKLSNFA